MLKSVKQVMHKGLSVQRYQRYEDRSVEKD